MTNYKKLFAIQYKLSKEIKLACPQISDASGIYILKRTDEDGNHIYVGKAKHLLKRMVSHLQGYKQKIDISLKKRGFYHNLNNVGGWHLTIQEYAENELDEKEAYFINHYKALGYDMYNIESGGTKGKGFVNERKEAKGYSTGLKNGYKKAQKEISNLFTRYLDAKVKKDNISCEKALKKFNDFIGD